MSYIVTVRQSTDTRHALPLALYLTTSERSEAAQHADILRKTQRAGWAREEVLSIQAA